MPGEHMTDDSSREKFDLARMLGEGPVRTQLSFRQATVSTVRSLGQVSARLVPARLRRIYVPSAYSPIDRLAVVFFGFLCGLFQATGRFPLPVDAWTYWTADLAHLYAEGWGSYYVYPPPLAQIITILHPLGWQVFVVGWTTLLWVALAYMLGRWTWLFVAAGIAAVPLGYGAPPELGEVLGSSLGGNVQLLIAAGIVVAMRGNALGWLPGLLTKVFSGLGLVWHLARFEWRPLAISLGATAAVAAVSFVFTPSQWGEWIAWLVRNVGSPAPVALEPVPFVLRLPMSLALLLWGARTNRAWIVPIAVGWGTPALYLGSYPSIWVGAIPLFLERRRLSGLTASLERRPPRALRGGRSRSPLELGRR